MKFKIYFDSTGAVADGHIEPEAFQGKNNKLNLFLFMKLAYNC